MFFDNKMTEELNEISANFDPLLNQDFLRVISLRESLVMCRKQTNNVGFVYSDDEQKLDRHDLDEFEQALT
jgi:hypothetical protein